MIQSENEFTTVKLPDNVTICYFDTFSIPRQSHFYPGSTVHIPKVPLLIGAAVGRGRASDTGSLVLLLKCCQSYPWISGACGIHAHHSFNRIAHPISRCRRRLRHSG